MQSRAGRPGGRPLRMRNKVCGKTGRCGHRPLRRVTGSACGQADVGIVPYSFLPVFPLREKFVLLFSVACGTMRLGILYAKKYALHPGRPERQQEV